ncbi:MAG TPA: NBR1-Ig-like domain-containing protein [Anaerolineales bacterium]|nr:NBR1-Ig-like domain-containing protein [Anaerolineales bacterium]
MFLDLTNKYKILIVLISLTLGISSCVSPSQSQSEIATSVAQTVQAQNSLTKAASIPIATSVPTLALTPTPSVDPTHTSAPIAIPGCTLSAVLVAESPPDNVLLKPGEYFWKTWSLQNTGTCTWDSSYKLVFWSGERMGGLDSYAFPTLIAPGETKDVSIYLKAPEAEGTYTGYWQIQSPWGVNFGVGQANAPFYVQISVSNTPQYGIISVTYELVRNPATGCPVNVRYRVYATITVNGPYEFTYFWAQSDGNNSKTDTMQFTQAGSKTIWREWMIGRGDSPNPRWMRIIVTEPKYQEYDKAVILNNCP